MRLIGVLPIVLCLCVLLITGCGRKEQKHVSFRLQVQPVLQSRCASCHSGEGAAGRIVLTSYRSLMASRTVKGRKPLVIPENLNESWLYVLSGTDQPHFRMPPDTSRITPLPAEDLKVMGEWIMQGAKDN